MSKFHTTRWSLVFDARSGSEQATQAFAELCSAYRSPVLAFIRARGHSPTDAEDLTQGFFLKLTEKRYETGADPARGRFRTYLLTAVKGFLANAFDAASSQKRGGGAVHESLDYHDTLPTGSMTPEQAFERDFALTVVERAIAHLRDEADAMNQSTEFSALSKFLIDASAAGDYEMLATGLGISTNAFAARVRRLRLRLTELIRVELAETLENVSQLDDEAHTVQRALRG